MENALMVKDLSKSFSEFSLKNISFTVPSGAVTGLIGENGSGKSTCIKCILGQDIPDGGQVTIYGQDGLSSPAVHKLIGSCSESCGMPEMLNSKEISSFMKDIFEKWDQAYYEQLLEKFNVPIERAVKKMSRGMKMKLSLCVCLAHHPDLLILDEATAGLDPVVREDILDLLMEFMEDEHHAIFMTSHITSDIERIADYILFIQNGSIQFMIEKEQVKNYGLASLTKNQMEFLDPELMLFVREQPLSQQVLIKDRLEFKKRYPDYACDQASLDDVILMFSKGERV